MDRDEHQRERMRAFRVGARIGWANGVIVLKEFDAQFPAPKGDNHPNMIPSLRANVGHLSDQLETQEAELASLRQKARLWDAVADGAINLSYYESAGFQASWPAPAANGGTARCGSGSKHTAAEAVEAAIAAGALK